jgi:16S rRNA (cytosine1402-N4)-methyltransferase
MPLHVPVLVDVVADLAAGARRAVDATVGGGGHAARLRALGATVFAIDRDPAALAAARGTLGPEGFLWREGAFGDPAVLEAIARFRPDLALLDLGLSSDQLDDAARGFSFRPGAPLDMRMTPHGPTAADLLNRATAEELSTIFRDYGDERHARRLARSVVRRRTRHPFATSDDLVAAVRETLGSRSGAADFARLFQAVRIAVNDELEQLRLALPALRDALVPGGRLLVISYHSGEDRIVKHAFREWARACVCPPGMPVCRCRGRALGTLDPRRAVAPSPEEAVANRRARSARLRGFRIADGA